MPKQVRTAKGKVIDFDLLRIKQQMVKNNPTPPAVKARQDFVDKRLRRKAKNAKTEMLDVKQEDKVKLDATKRKIKKKKVQK